MQAENNDEKDQAEARLSAAIEGRPAWPFEQKPAKARLKVSLSKEELAEVAGVNRQHISEIEKGG